MTYFPRTFIFGSPLYQQRFPILILSIANKIRQKGLEYAVISLLLFAILYSQYLLWVGDIFHKKVLNNSSIYIPTKSFCLWVNKKIQVYFINLKSRQKFFSRELFCAHLNFEINTVQVILNTVMNTSSREEHHQFILRIFKPLPKFGISFLKKRWHTRLLLYKTVREHCTYLVHKLPLVK